MLTIDCYEDITQAMLTQILSLETEEILELPRIRDFTIQTNKHKSLAL